DLGYLDRDVAGKLHFVSLLPHVPPANRAFGDVWNTVVTPEAVYFLTSGHLFRWDGKRMHRWGAGTRFTRMQQVGGQLFVHQQGRGLYALENGELRPFAESEPFTQTNLTALLPAPGGQMLVVTRDRGLFRMTDGRCVPFGSEAGAFLTEHECYHAVQLPHGGYAFGTVRGGVLFTDADGRIERILNKETGLISNNVYHLFVDGQEGLWMATSNGVSRMETFSPFSRFGESNGLVGNIQELRRYRGKLYASTGAGLFVLESEPGTGKPARFRPVPGFADRVLRLFRFRDRMLIAGNRHLYELHGERLRIIRPGFKTSGLHTWGRNPNLVFAASEGLFVLRWTGNGWQDEGRVPGIHENMHTITETPSGDLYLATRWQGTLRVRFPLGPSGDLQKAQLQRPDIVRYGAAQGLPSGVNRFYWAGNRLLLRIGEDDFTLHELDPAGQFKTLPNPGPRIAAGVVKAYPALDTLSAGWWWTQFPADKKWSLTRVPAGPGGPPTNYNLNRITEYTGKSLYVEGDTVVWFRGIEDVVRYRLGQPPRGTGAFRVLLDRVVINGDSTLYPHDGLRAAELPYAYNTLRFEYAAPAYDGAAENEFQYQLAGYDRGWSAWTKDFYKEYTRIPEGRYTFRVRARNLYGKVGTEAAYTVTIAPPWYRTWPVYGAYVLLATGLLYGLVRRRMAALQQRNLELEKIIRDRTWEIANKNELLDAQNAQLQAQAGQLARQTTQLLELDEMKSSFFANISHEFRTPLTLVLGILNDKAAQGDERRSGAPVPVSPREIGVMQRNARRLLQLINQLLDLSRIDSGRMKLHLQDGNLADLLALVVASFASLAEYRNIRFEVQLPDGPLYCRFDADKLEKVLYNLLSNAFKFTPYGGTVALDVHWEPAPAGPNEANTAPGRLRLGVRDSGPGIPADQLEKVFDRFFQGAQLYQGDAQGTGIGLALTRELVQLHGGRIWAESPGGA
ncbi:MAG TPA: ATP-binding protein, partial [Cytophagales bacterium]